MTEKKSKDELAKQLVEREIMVCQSGLIDTILKHSWDDRWVADELFTIDDIENYYIRYDIDDLIRDNPQEYEEFILDNGDLLTETYYDEFAEFGRKVRLGELGEGCDDPEDVEQFLDWLEEHAPFGDEEG